MKLIAGMHRSGSSILAKVLREAGADFGDEETFYPADKWNPDGYFEQREILDINLRLVNGNYGKLSYAFLPSDETILKRSYPIQSKIESAISKFSDKVVKENRFCLTLNAWIAHGLTVEKAIICIRHPALVARSLWKRNRLPAWFGYRIWYQHHERLLEALYTNGIPYKVVSHEAFVSEQNQQAELLGLLRFFELDEAFPFADELLKKNVHTKPDEEHSKALPLPVAELYQRLLNQSRE